MQKSSDSRRFKVQPEDASKRIEEVQKQIVLIKNRFVYVLRHITLVALTPKQRVLGENLIDIYYIKKTFNLLFDGLKKLYREYIGQILLPIIDLPQNEKSKIVEGNLFLLDRLVDVDGTFLDLEKILIIFEEIFSSPRVERNIQRKEHSLLSSIDMDNELFVSCLRIAASTPNDPITYLCTTAMESMESKSSIERVNVNAVLQIIAITQNWPIPCEFDDNLVDLDKCITTLYFPFLWSHDVIEVILKRFIFYEGYFDDLSNWNLKY